MVPLEFEEHSFGPLEDIQFPRFVIEGRIKNVLLFKLLCASEDVVCKVWCQLVKAV